MKDLIHSWKFWVAIAVAVLLVIGIVLYLCVPEFKDIVKSIGICLGCILAGFIGGYFAGQKYGRKFYRKE